MGATIFGRRHNANCCCDSGCIGCCVPVDAGTNAPQNIPFEISAPSCPELDGWAGIFVPVAPPLSQDLSRCGVCGIYAANNPTPSIDGDSYNPPSPCVLLPSSCTIGPFRFGLHCTTPLIPLNESLATCCRRLLLSMNLNGGTSEDDVYVNPTSCVCDPLSAIYDISGLFPLFQTWVDPGVTCPIDGCFPNAGCDLTGATLII